MKFLQITAAIVAISVLNGCVTTSAQQTYNSGEQTLSDIGAEIKSCTNAAWNSEPELKNILSLENSQNPQKTKDNKSYIGQMDKESMSLFAAKMKQCRERGQEKIESSPDYYVRSFAAISQESIDLRNNIYKKYLNGEITGGAAALSLENVHQHLARRWEEQQQKLVNQLNQQHFQEKQAQATMLQAIGAGFQDYSNQQEHYQNTYNQPQIRMPVHTSCQWNGGIMICTSY